MGLFDGWDAKDIGLTVATGGTYGVANGAYKMASGSGDNLTDAAGRGFKSAADARKSNWTSHDFGDNRNYNPNAFNYGGFQGGANYYSQQAFDEQGREQSIDDYYRQQAEQAQGRQIYQDPRYQQDQNNAMDLAKSAAYGQQPSAAQIMMGQGLDQAAAQQQAMAGGARGAAGIALAQGNAASATANMQQQGVANAARLRADEMAQARGMYGQMSMGAKQNDFQNQLANRNANDQYGLGLGQLAQGRSQTAQGYYNAGLGVQANQLQAQGNQQNMLANSDQATQQQNAAVNMQKTNADKELQQQAIGMFGSSVAGGMSGGVGGR